MVSKAVTRGRENKVYIRSLHWTFWAGWERGRDEISLFAQQVQSKTTLEYRKLCMPLSSLPLRISGVEFGGWVCLPVDAYLLIDDVIYFYNKDYILSSQVRHHALFLGFWLTGYLWGQAPGHGCMHRRGGVLPVSILRGCCAREGMLGLEQHWLHCSLPKGLCSGDHYQLPCPYPPRPSVANVYNLIAKNNESCRV